MEGQPDILDHASTTRVVQPATEPDPHPHEPDATPTPISTLPEPGGDDTPANSSNVDALEKEIQALRLDDRPPETMFRSLSSIFQAAQVHESHVGLASRSGGADLWILLRQAAELESSGTRDVESLKVVRGAFEQMLWSSSKLLLPGVQIVADASRDESWRAPLGESGLLDFCLIVIMNANAPEELQRQALRLVGNSCADTDENRARVLASQHLHVIVSRIESPQFSSVAVPVLYNICFEYAPAQKDAVACGLFPTIIRTLDGRVLDPSNPAFGHLCRLIDIGSEHLDAERSPANAVEVLLHTATQPNLDVDDITSLVDSAVAHLELEQFQQHMLDHELFGIPLRFLVRSYFPQSNLVGAKIPSTSGTQSPSRDRGEEAELSRVRKALIQALSDVSALPDFRTKNASLDTQLIETVMGWLTAALPQIQLCSCILLGNLARSDDTCHAMVARLSLHKYVIAILRTGTDTSVLHSALGFLRNLALFQENKALLGEAGLMDALTRFWGSDFMPQVSHASAAVARQLVVGNIPNIEKLLTPLSTDEDSPAHARTYFSLLLSLFEKSDELAVQIEIARTTASVLRAIHSTDSQNQDVKTELAQRLYSQHPNVGAPLGVMVSQSRYPVVRSEGWFAMALMGRNLEGGKIISAVVSEVKVFTALEEAIRGTSDEPESSSSATPVTDPATPFSPSSQATSNEMRAKDRDNAMILVSELLQHRAGDLVSSIRRSALQDLLQDGARSARE